MNKYSLKGIIEQLKKQVLRLSRKREKKLQS